MGAAVEAAAAQSKTAPGCMARSGFFKGPNAALALVVGLDDAAGLMHIVGDVEQLDVLG